MTAIVATGLAERAHARAAEELPPATGVHAGLRFATAQATSGTLDIAGDALLTLVAYDLDGGLDTSRRLRIRARIADRAGWLSATPDLELRMVTADVSLPLDGASGDGASATITLHDARVFGQSWERLTLGTGDGAVPVLPEARVLLAAAVQRIRADVAGTASVALTQLLSALALTDATGGLAGDAVDQLIHDPAGLVRARLAAAQAEIASAMSTLLGPLGATIDLASRAVHVVGGSEDSGRFGWHSDVTAGLSGISGEVRFGTAARKLARGEHRMHRAARTVRRVAALAPAERCDAAPSRSGLRLIRRSLRARSPSVAPSLGAQVGLEIMRRADDDARPVIDAALDALGLLGGAPGDARRAVRPLAGLIADPAGWLRSTESVAANAAKIQEFFDALRPLLGVGGAVGTPLPFAAGVALGVAPDGAGARLTLSVDPTAWAAPGGITARLAAGLDASLSVFPSGPPTVGIEAHVGLTGAAPGRQAAHVRLGDHGIELFVRPTAGADISLIPFAGLGALAAAAEMALPFLLDQLAQAPDPVGPLVATVGDALALRSGAPKKFDGTALHAWALDPVGALSSAVPSIVSTGLTAIAPLVDDFVPAGVNVTANATTLTITIGDFSLVWNPGAGSVRVVGDGVAVPGIEELSFTLGLSAAGLDELSITAGPAAIPAGGVTLRPFVTVAAGNAPTGGRRVAVGMALDDTHRFAARWLIDSSTFDIIASDGDIVSALETTDPLQVGLRIVEVIADLVAAVAMAQQPVSGSARHGDRQQARARHPAGRVARRRRASRRRCCQDCSIRRRSSRAWDGSSRISPAPTSRSPSIRSRSQFTKLQMESSASTSRSRIGWR